MQLDHCLGGGGAGDNLWVSLALSIDGVSVTARSSCWQSILFRDYEAFAVASLSKFQFYAWTAAGVFGYILLTLAQSLVQGRFVFADIPKNLPGIILISAATTATSQGITSVKGAKGAGDIYPSVADFVTTGGLVVARAVPVFSLDDRWSFHVPLFGCVQRSCEHY